MTTITLLDGGMSRELQHWGAELRQPEWSAVALIETPEIVQVAHEAFLKAGAQVITTNSYAVVPFHLGEERFARDGAALATDAARLARAAADKFPGARVAGSLPPPCGSYMPEAFDAAIARPILDMLVGAMQDKVDLWVAETLSSLAEARCAVAAAKSSGKPVWLSFTLHDSEGALDQPPALRSGESVAEAARLAQELGAEALLFNCSMPEVMEPAIKAARAAFGDAQLPIGIYANAFESQDDDGAANEVLSQVRKDLTPAGYLQWVDQWIAAGATMVGGCCGIGSEHIAAIAAHLAQKA
ncbi:homocysteine S-methyltransferase family protein [Thioclava sp. FTW29]|uniref:Homocysteine S-methyltransferase family protein n=1 Tax=Thioclava litoralis TaxID=3076557 RepID=A0ABZ1E4J3_9RHOB|nr:homocysteine S-methyltransferase family protein [Thioclava sp. FTW29]